MIETSACLCDRPVSWDITLQHGKVISYEIKSATGAEYVL